MLVRLRRAGWLCFWAAVCLGCGSGATETHAGPVSTDTSVSADTPASEPAGPVYACDADSPCSAERQCRSGVCLLDPEAGEVAVLTDATGLAPYAVDEAPDLSCVGQATPDASGETVTLYGAVSRFGSGLVTTDIRVEVFLASEWNPVVCESEPAGSRQADCYRGYGAEENAATHGLQPIGSALSVAAGDIGTEVECTGHGDCPLGYECLAGDLDSTCLEQFGVYSIEGVPTNTPLVVRSYATTNERKWHDVYMFGVYLYGDRVDSEGRYHYDVTMVSTGQWELTANIAGIGEIPEEHGAIGGRVRDCRVVGVCKGAEGAAGGECTLDADCADGEVCEGGRASWPIGGVTIGLAEPAEEIVYFNNLEDDTVPLDFRTTTNVLGRYAALDIPPGWNTIAGVTRIEDEVVSVGAASVYVVPDSLSIVGWPGLQPHWKQD